MCLIEGVDRFIDPHTTDIATEMSTDSRPGYQPIHWWTPPVRLMIAELARHSDPLSKSVIFYLLLNQYLNYQ